MANTLTGLMPTVYKALDKVAREQVGFIPASVIDASAATAAVGQTIRSPIAPVATLSDVTPGVTPPNDGGQTITYVDMSITKVKRAPIQWTGEEQLVVGSLANTILQDQFAQAFRALANAVEVDLGAEIATMTTPGRLVGTAGTTPFGTADNLMDFADMARVLDENGAPIADRHFVMGHKAKANLRGKHPELFKVNESGSADLLRAGVIGDSLMGFNLHASSGVALVDAATDYRANAAFVKGALQLLARAPAVPAGGDSALDRMYVTDPISGLVFEVTMWGGYRQTHIEVALAWGVKLIKPEFVTILMGEST